MTEFFWDKEARIYRRASGRAISETQIKSWLESLLAVVALRFKLTTQQAVSEEINFRTWFDQMQTEINSLHRAGGALAFGGFSQMQSADHAFVEQTLQEELAYFRNFSALFYNGSLTENQATARASLYGLAGYKTYENSRAKREQNAGILVYKRNLTPGNNCQECIDFAFLGWQLIGTLPAIGANCSCRSNCRCFFSFSTDLSLLQNKK